MKSIILEQLKKIYSQYVRQVSARTKKQPIKKQVVYLLSFPNNDHGLIETLSKEFDVAVCYTRQLEKEAMKLKSLGIPIWNINSYQGLRKTIKLVSTSRIVLADNYFAFLGDIIKGENQLIFQIWHATGAIKQFGLEDKTAQKRSNEDQERFKRVYQSFDYFVVGSKAMAEVFKNSYGAREEQMLYLGFPRTDFLHQIKQVEKNTQKVVYLPTYREIETNNIVEDLLILRKKIDPTMDLYIKPHPHENWGNKEELQKTEGIYLLDGNTSSDELLTQADILITDYSSVAFDYALVHPLGKLIFYWYDESVYINQTGIQDKLRESMPSKICYTIEEVLHEIKNEEQNLSTFNDYWNTHNDGKAVERLLEVIKKELDV